MPRRLLVLALAGLALAGCGDEAEPGDVVGVAEVRGPTQVVLIPPGELALTITNGAEEDLPEGSDGPGAVAGDGRWVGVAWDLRPGRRDGVAALALEHEPVKAPELALVADGRRYPIGPAYAVDEDGSISSGESTRRYVAVAGDPKDLAVAVTFDGVTQVIDPASTDFDVDPAAQGLYTIITREPACTGTATARPPLDGVDVRCEVDESALVPYVGGLGWAEPGRAWAVVDVVTGLAPDRPLPSWRGKVDYVVTSATRTATVAGEPPAATLRSESGATDDRGRDARVLVFDVDAERPGALELEPRLELRPEEPGTGAPAKAEVVVRQRAPLG